MSATRRCAVLLLGPTGSGKTPLGGEMQRRGLHGRRCVHFDFGAQLRAVAAASVPPPGLTAEEAAVVRRALARNLLLENDTFRVAAHILEAFVDSRRVGPRDIIVMNGLPRHVGQAAGVDRIVRFEKVVSLECAPEVAAERIARDSGGDRAGRSDDSPAEIRRKFALFRSRTLPLLDHYRAEGVCIVPICVTVSMNADDMLVIVDPEPGTSAGQPRTEHRKP